MRDVILAAAGAAADSAVTSPRQAIASAARSRSRDWRTATSRPPPPPGGGPSICDGLVGLAGHETNPPGPLGGKPRTASGFFAIMGSLAGPPIRSSGTADRLARLVV